MFLAFQDIDDKWKSLREVVTSLAGKGVDNLDWQALVQIDLTQKH